MQKLDSRKCWAQLAPQLINHPDCPDWLRSLAHETVSARVVTEHAPPFSLDYAISLYLVQVDERAVADRDKFLEFSTRSENYTEDGHFGAAFRRDTEFLRSLVGTAIAQFVVDRKVRKQVTSYESGPVIWFSPDDFRLLRIASSIIVGNSLPR